MNAAKIFKWLAIAIGGCVALIIIAFIVIITLSTISSRHVSLNKADLEAAYKKVSLPASMSLTNSSWTGGNVDTANYWGYEYSTANPPQSMQELQVAAQQAGFVVQLISTAPGTPQSPAYVATNTASNTRFTFIQSGQDTISVQVFSASINRDYP